MKAITILSQIPASKEGIEVFVKSVVDNLMEGDIEPLSVRIKVDAIKKIMDGIKADSRFKDAVLDHADMWPEKSFDFEGVKVTKSLFTQYDYSDDPEWNELKRIETEAIENRKAREKVLFALKEPTKINGVECCPPVKRSQSIVKIGF